MKKAVWIVSALLLMLFCLISCASAEPEKDEIQKEPQESVETKSLTETTEKPQPPASLETADPDMAIGGAGSPYSEPYDMTFLIESRFYNLTPAEEMQAWLAQFEKFGEPDPEKRPCTEINVYNYIHELNIPREKWDEANELSLKWDETPFYSKEIVDLLYSDNADAVYAHFANPWGLCIGKTVYTPKWLFEHNAQDYQKAGITSFMLKEKLFSLRAEFTYQVDQDGESVILTDIPDRIEENYVELQRLEGIPEADLDLPDFDPNDFGPIETPQDGDSVTVVPAS